jgi:hypothetical protein
MPAMTIHTVMSLASKRRRLANRLEKAEWALTEMQLGQALHLQYAKQGPVWTLTSGREIPNVIARLVVASSSVIDVGDSLFGAENSLGQTWRYWP